MWRTRTPDGATAERGGLRGEYRELTDRHDDRVGGHFLGRWAETTCNVGVIPHNPLTPVSMMPRRFAALHPGSGVLAFRRQHRDPRRTGAHAETPGRGPWFKGE